MSVSDRNYPVCQHCSQGRLVPTTRCTYCETEPERVDVTPGAVGLVLLAGAVVVLRALLRLREVVSR